MNDNPQFPGVRKPTSDFGAIRSHLQTQPSYYDVDLSTARSLALGTALIIPLAGNFFFVDQRPSTGYATVRFEDVTPTGMPFTIYPGATYLVGFTQVCIENVAQPGMTMRIAAGVDVNCLPTNAAGVSVLNSISVVDGNELTTLAGVAFMGAMSQAAVAANNSHIQLWNPAASGKRLIVDGFAGDLGANGTIFLRSSIAALTGLVGNPANKNLGGAASAAENRTQAIVGVTGVATLTQIDLLANTPYTWKFTKPISITPGNGLLMVGNPVNVALNGSFEHYEKVYP